MTGPASLQLLRSARIFTSAGRADDAAAVVDDGAVGIGRDGRIAAVGPVDEVARTLRAGRDGPGRSGGSDGPGGPGGPGDIEELDLGGALVTPGLIDAHTHPVYGGRRYAEIAMRSAGASYSDIAAAGGGIASTVAATRAAGTAELAADLDARLAAWLAGGTTTLEAKTGYHLNEEGELSDVALLAERAAGSQGGPAIEVTWLAGHAVGPEWSGDADAYATEVARWAPAARQAGARHADVFCDAGYFTVDQSRIMLAAAKEAGLLPRIHADELARTGGAELAAELGCASADHLLQLDDAGVSALAVAGVTATLAPVTALAMGTSPPTRSLLDAGVTVALGTDHNPGTCGTTSMTLVLALAVAELGMSVAAALVAATAGGARSLRRDDRGRIEPGLRADLVAWDADHEGAFAWSYGLRPLAVWLEGERMRISPAAG